MSFGTPPRKLVGGREDQFACGGADAKVKQESLDRKSRKMARFPEVIEFGRGLHLEWWTLVCFPLGVQASWLNAIVLCGVYIGKLKRS